MDCETAKRMWARVTVHLKKCKFMFKFAAFTEFNVV